MSRNWHTCRSPRKMFQTVLARPLPRRKQLAAVGFCRLAWHLLVDERSRHAVEMAERYADWEVRAEDVVAVQEPARAVILERLETHPEAASEVWDEIAYPADAAWRTSLSGENHLEMISERLAGPKGSKMMADMLARQADLLRDLFLPPGVVAPMIDRDTLTANVRDLARTIYDERAFDHMPILADALMDIGCVDEMLLGHLREERLHVRGCWALDAVRGVAG